MANLGSLALAAGAVGTISIMGFLFLKKQNLELDENIAKNIFKDLAPENQIVAIKISQNKNAALIESDGDKIFIIKSMGRDYAIRKISPSNIVQNGDKITFRFNDFTFPDFSATFPK